MSQTVGKPQLTLRANCGCGHVIAGSVVDVIRGSVEHILTTGHQVEFHGEGRPAPVEAKHGPFIGPHAEHFKAAVQP